MIIKDYAVEMSASNTYQAISSQEEKLRFWVGEPPSNNGEVVKPTGNLLTMLDTVDISDEAKKTEAVNKEETEVLQLTPADEAKIRMIKTFLEALTGKKIRFFLTEHQEKNAEIKLPAAWKQINTPPNAKRSGWGMEYNYSATYQEQEKLSFKSAGIITTADGKQIDFTVQMNMSRNFVAREDIHIRAGDAAAIDPLAINFDGPAVALTERNFKFDLDTDGQEELIAFAQSGSGFLTLDLNKDGKINNGSELFGPATGNGFIELGQYDEDGNNWIDENDSIYNKLRIWTKDEQGNDILFALGQKNIGAIFLGNIRTPFAMKNTANETNGELRTTGIFLRENGTAGTIQQVDLVV